MTRTAKAVAGVLSTLLILGPCASASAGNDPPPSAPKLSQLERDKNTFIARVQQGIDKANTDIESLARLADDAKGAAKDRFHHLQKALTVMRDLLNDDRDKVTSATLDDWSDVRAMVQSDLSGTNGEIRIAMALVKPPQKAQTGVTNKQPNTK